MSHHIQRGRSPTRALESPSESESSSSTSSRDSSASGYSEAALAELASMLPRHWRTRARSTSASRTAQVARTSPGEQAEVGFEEETDDILLKPGGPRHHVIGELSNTRLEVDRNLVNNNSHVEFVGLKTTSIHVIDQANIAKAAMVSALLMTSERNTGVRRRVPVAEVLETVRAGQSHQRFEVRSSIPSARLQSTFGVSLADFNDFLELHPVRAIIVLTRNLAAVIKTLLSRECHVDELSQRLAGFIDVMAYYIVEAQKPASRTSTPKAQFLLMLRSDFHSIFVHLLDAKDRMLARVLLLPDTSAGKEALAVRAIRRRGTDRFFREKYLSGTGNRVDGPTYAEWFSSIALGRGRGQFAKDANSPPRGFAFHIGDPAVDYTMGQKGVDIINGLMFIELRRRLDRPDRIMLNSHLRTHGKREMQIAMRFNPELGDPDDVTYNEHENDWVDLSTTALSSLGRIQSALLQRTSYDRGRVLQRLGLGHVSALENRFVDWGWTDRHTDVAEAFDVFGDAMRVGRRRGATTRQINATLPAVHSLIKRIWDVDAAEDSDESTESDASSESDEPDESQEAYESDATEASDSD